MSTEHDEIKEVTPPKDELAEFIDEISSQVKTAITNRSEKTTEWDDAFRWRKGMVGKPNPNLPWKNSSDIRFRLSEPEIRVRNALMVESVMKAPRMTRFIHSSDSAGKLEAYFDFILLGEMPDWRSICAAEVDVLNETGLLITKQSWEYCTEPMTIAVERDEVIGVLANAAMLSLQTKLMGLPPPPELMEKIKTPETLIETMLTKAEREKIIAAWKEWDLDEDDNGIYKARVESVLKQLDDKEDTIEIIVDRKIRDGIRVTPFRDPNTVVWGPQDSVDIQEAEWVVHRMRMTKRQLQSKSVVNGGKYKNVEKLLELVTESTETDTDIDQGKTARDYYNGVTSPQNEKGYINIWELHCFMPRKFIRGMKGKTLGDGESVVRAIITFCPDVDASVVPPLRVMEYPYEFRTSRARWCFESHRLNLGRGTLYDAEGIPKAIRAYEKAYNIDMNAGRDRNSITLTPPIVKRAGVGIKDKQLRQWPCIIEVDAMVGGNVMEHIGAINYPNLSQGFQNDAESLKQMAREVIGTANLQDLQRYSDSPSATQVQAVQQPSNLLSQFELAGYHDFKARQYRQLYDLLWECRFRDEETSAVEFTKMDGSGESLKITRDDFKPDYIILSGADVYRDNPILQAQKRFAGAQFVMSRPEFAPFRRIGEIYQIITHDFFGPMYASRVSVPMPEAMKRQAEQEDIKNTALQMAAAEEAARKKSGGGKSGPMGGGVSGVPNLANADSVNLNTGMFTSQ